MGETDGDIPTSSGSHRLEQTGLQLVPAPVTGNPPPYSLQPPKDNVTVAESGERQPPPYEPARPPPPYNRCTWTSRSGAQSVAVIEVAQPQTQSLSSPPSSSIIIACAVFWFCGFLFGALALVLAVVARRKSSSRTQVETTVYLNRASLAVSAAGVITGVLLLVILLSVYVTPVSHINESETESPPLSTTSRMSTVLPTPQCLFEHFTDCYSYVSNFSISDCQTAGGRTFSLNTSFTCILKACPTYTVLDKYCFHYESRLVERSRCEWELRGFYVRLPSGFFCYYNICPGSKASNNICYMSKVNSTRSDCTGFYEDGFCYTGTSL